MCEMDFMELWREQVTERCNQALLRLRKESVEYGTYVRERVTFSAKCNLSSKEMANCFFPAKTARR